MQSGSDKRFDVTGFGESMLRLSVPTGQRLSRMHQLDVHFAGAESNVLAALSCLGRRCGWSSGLPSNEIGRFAARELRSAGIEAEPVFIKEGRIGTYFVEFASSPRSTSVIYDRAESAINHLRPEQLDLSFLLDTEILHLTGITPALSDACYQMTQFLIDQAKTAKVKVSFDVNYRSKLWSVETAARRLSPLIQAVDLLICSQRDAVQLFGCPPNPDYSIAGAERVVQELAEQTDAGQIVVSIGAAGVVGWNGQVMLHEPAWPVDIVDRIGAGDAMAAGILHGLLDGDLKSSLLCGALMGALALFNTRYGLPE